MDRATRSMMWRLCWGGVLNLLWMVPAIYVISAQIMGVAEVATGLPFDWPRLERPSAFSEGARNGYLVIVGATLAVMLLSSGILGGILSASPGKSLTGIRYGTTFGASAGPFRMLWRALLLIVVTGQLLLVGPGIGFLVGGEADLQALGALVCGCVILGLSVFPLGSEGRSLVNRWSGLRPYRRQRT